MDDDNSASDSDFLSIEDAGADSGDARDEEEGGSTASSDDEDEDERASTTAALASPAKPPAATTAKTVPQIINDKPAILDPIDEDFKAREESCLKLNTPNNSLFSTSLSNQEIMELVRNFTPSLSRRDRRMADFINMVRAAVDRADPPTFPSIESEPQWWASTNE